MAHPKYRAPRFSERIPGRVRGWTGAPRAPPYPHRPARAWVVAPRTIDPPPSRETRPCPRAAMSGAVCPGNHGPSNPGDRERQSDFVVQKRRCLQPPRKWSERPLLQQPPPPNCTRHGRGTDGVGTPHDHDAVPAYCVRTTLRRVRGGLMRARGREARDGSNH